jgi:hypothetical protein
MQKLSKLLYPLMHRQGIMGRPMCRRKSLPNIWGVTQTELSGPEMGKSSSVFMDTNEYPPFFLARKNYKLVFLSFSSFLKCTIFPCNNYTVLSHTIISYIFNPCTSPFFSFSCFSPFFYLLVVLKFYITLIICKLLVSP